MGGMLLRQLTFGAAFSVPDIVFHGSPPSDQNARPEKNEKSHLANGCVRTDFYCENMPTKPLAYG